MEDDNGLLLRIIKIDEKNIYFDNDLVMPRLGTIAALLAHVKYKRAYHDSIPLNPYSTLEEFERHDTIAFTSHRDQDLRVMNHKMDTDSKKERLRFGYAIQSEIDSVMDEDMHEKNKEYLKQLRKYYKMYEVMQLELKIEELEARIEELEN